MFKQIKAPFSKTKKLAKKQPESLKYEALEPRVLFSADIVPGLDNLAIEEQVLVEDIANDPQVERESAPLDTEQTAAKQRWELLLVNDNVADYEQLIADLQAGGDNRIIEVVVLASDQDGIKQVTETLTERSDLAAVHFITHGNDGQINLGDSRLTSTTLRQNSDAVAGWGNALTENGDILFYGCNIAADSDGQTLLNDIAKLTGAEVAASDNLTGNEALGGDWQLEYKTGAIEVQVAISKQVMDNYRAVLESTSTNELTYLSTPLTFEQNNGQTDQQVDFVARGSGYTVFLTEGDAVLRLQEGDAGHVVRLDLLGADASAPVSGADLLSSQSNYLIGNDESNWQTAVANYGAVEYANVYDGIDLRYYGNQRQLEYDFIVSAGADTSQIRLNFEGVQSTGIDENGALLLTLNEQGDQIGFKAPISYQFTEDGSREAVQSRYVLYDDGTIGFDLGAYDSSRELVIDPILDYATFLGGLGSDSAYGIAVDASGNVYVAGSTGSSDFPTQSGYDASLGGTGDAFISKFNATGTALLYSTYFGGANSEWFTDIAVDSAGNAYVVGYTTSADLPTRNAYDTSLSGSQNAFVAKFDPSLSGASSLLYSSYFGGTTAEYGTGIAVDSLGNAYVTGWTQSSDFSTKNPFDSSLGGTQDAFVAKFDLTQSSTASLIYATFLGGSGTERGEDITVDAAGKASITGSTDSGDFSIGNNFYDNTSAGDQDAFVAQLDVTGTSLPYSTYLGQTSGGGVESGFGIAADSSGMLYVAGETESANFDTTVGAFDTTYGGAGDAFVVKLDPTQSGAGSLVYSTYLGGSGDEANYSTLIAVDSSGRAHALLTTKSAVMTVTGDAHDSTLGGTQDAFLVILNAAGSNQDYATYVGGADTDAGTAIALDSNDNIYLTGRTDSGNFPATNGAYDESLGGSRDAFVVKFKNLSSPVVDTTSTGTSSGGNISIPHTTSGSDRLMLVGVSINDLGANSVSGITYNGDALTRVGWQQDGGARVEVWSLVNPDVGTYNVNIDIVGTSGGNTAGVMTFTGVDQTTPLGEFSSGAGVSGNGWTNISSAADELVFAAISVDNPTDYDLVPGAGQTERWDLFGGGNISGGGSTEAGTASVLMDWTWSGTDSWAAGGVSIKPASNAAPTITSNSGGATASINVAENTTAVTTVTATDVDAGDILTYSIDPASDDAAKFNVNSTTGELSFNTAPDFESPADANGDNVYEVTVKVDDGNGGIDTQAISVTVTNVLELVVTNTNATGSGSLHQAILDANANVGVTDTITFNIGGGGPQTIAVDAAGLPIVTDSVILDATTQPGYSGTPLITLDGSATPASSGINGIDLRANDSIVKGFIVINFADEGIEMDGSTGFGDNNIIQNNWVGIDAAGNVAGNAEYGIMISVDATGNQIGGTGPNEGNVVAGNGFSGIIIRENSDNNIVEGNIIGLKPDGTTPAGNGDHGIIIRLSSDGNRIGGTTAGAGNIIAGNTQDGIYIDGTTDATYTTVSTGTVIQGNWVGTTGTGSTGVGNGNTGINVEGTDTIIGGTGTNDGNVITNNGNEGINVAGAGATGTIIQGNIVGLDPDGSTGSGNADVGIALLAGAHNTTIGGTTAAARNVISNNFEGIEINSNNNVVQGNYIGTDSGGMLDRGNHSDDGVEIQNGATGNLIGGTAAGAGNLIAFNASDGVYVASGVSNSILGNRIHSNSGLGIDLGTNGVTANDAGDGDTGGNNLQNFPIISQADLSGTELTVSGTLDTDGLNTQYRLEFFGNAAGTQDPTNGEGWFYLGSTIITADGSGDGMFSSILLAGVTLSPGDDVTATATKIEDPAQVGSNDLLAYGSTSEFALNVTTAAANDVPVVTASAGTTAYTEQAVATVIDAGITLVDADGFAGVNPSDQYTAVIQITGNYQAADTLGFTNTSNIQGVLAGDTLALSVIGGQTATVADFQAALRTVTFYSGSDTPSGLNRTITFSFDDGVDSSNLSTKTVQVTAVNDAPVITSDGGGPTASIYVAENTTAVTTVTATDADGDTPTFSITGGGDASLFDIDTNSGTLTFKNPPDFDNPADSDLDNVYVVEVTADDGNGGTDVQTITATITNNDNGIWISPDQDAGPPGADGLPGGWREGEVFQFGGPDLTLGPVTDGDFSSVIDFDVFAVGTTDPGALHFVSRDLTIGSGANQFDLQIGDVLVSFNQDEDILAAYYETGTQTTVHMNDLLAFRPDTLGDYTSGTFYTVLNGVPDPTGAPINSLHAISLVEQDTFVGATLLEAGSFIFSEQIGVAPNTPNHIYHFTPTVAGQAAAAGTSQILIDGNDINIEVGSNIRGLDLIEKSTTIGGLTLDSGDILVTLKIDDGAVGDAPSLNTSTSDIFVLKVTQSEPEPGNTTAATAEMVLDGSQVNFDGTERVYAISVVPDNYGPAIGGDNTGAVTEDVGVVGGNISDSGTLSIADPDAGESFFVAETVAGTYGSLTIDAAGAWTYTADNSQAAIQSLDAGESLSDVLMVTTVDGTTQRITITINGTEDTPLINDLTTSVAEDAANTTVVTNIDEANTGNDTDLDGQALTYSITAGNADGIFTIDGANGEISVSDNTNLDYESTQQYVLTVEATDGSNTDTAAVTIDVTNGNDNAPLINDLTTSVAEDAANTTVVTNINEANTGNDTDLDGQSLTYSITAGNADGIFAIDSATGEISVSDNTNLDYESTQQYVLTVEATDGSNTDTAAITIDVTNITDNAPLINDLTTSVAEDAANTTVVTNIDEANTGNDTDLDGQSLTYSITGGNADGIFTIDGATGEISVSDNTNLDYESTQQYVLTVEATDGTNTDTAAITIDVMDVVESAAFTIDAIADAIVAENSAFTSVTPNISGDAPVGSVTYTLTGTDAALFTVDAGTGVVSMIARDYESPADANTDNVYEVSLVATDDDGNTDSEDFTVSVTPVSDSTPVATADTITVSEGGTAALLDGGAASVLTNDSGLTDTPVTVSLVTDVTQGSLTLNADGTFSYTHNGSENFTDSFTYRITDNDGQTSDAVVTITITPVNDAPTVTSSALTTATEDTTYSYAITTSDVDGNALTITAPTLPAWLTLVDNGDGTATLSGTPTSTEVGNHSVVLEVSDGVLTDTQNFTLNVSGKTIDPDATIVLTGLDDGQDSGDDGQDSREEIPNDEDPAPDPVIEAPPSPPIEQHSAPQGSGDAEEQSILLQDLEAEEIEEISLLADEIDETIPFGGGDDDRSDHYVDHELYKNRYLANYLDFNNIIETNALIPENGDDINLLDINGNEPNRVDINSDYDVLRQEVDELFDNELQSHAIKTKVVTIATASFTVGIVSYLLRAGSMVASLMSSLPLWRGFDPIAIFAGDKKKQKGRNKVPNAEQLKSETLFDKDAE